MFQHYALSSCALACALLSEYWLRFHWLRGDRGAPERAAGRGRITFCIMTYSTILYFILYYHIVYSTLYSILHAICYIFYTIYYTIPYNDANKTPTPPRIRFLLKARRALVNLQLSG